MVAVLFVLVIGMAAAFFMMWNKMSELSLQASQGAKAQTGVHQVGNKLGPLFPLETFIVNLNDERRNRYLRVTMDLELLRKPDSDVLKNHLSQVRDSILTILPAKRFEDISSSEGKTALREEIIAKLNSLFNQKVVSNIFFTEFVVQ
jgi:flagellar FliL protein